MMNRLFCFFAMLVASQGFAQTQQQDTTRLLQAVVVQAYATERSVMEVPASVGTVNREQLERFSNTSLLPAVNMIPGVRMEERSPGSYRFSIRGSLLRSPFGVRNVKVYWNGLPLTDGGGNTYLNLLDFDAVGSIEIIKGPGGSLYGAGTGGVVLLNSLALNRNSFGAGAVVGSFGLQRFHADAQLKRDDFGFRIQAAHHESAGYREQTGMRRDAVLADARLWTGSKGTLSATIFYTDLQYETPGGLTLEQYHDNPKQARPATTTFPGAVEQKAAVENRTVYAGLVQEYEWSRQWKTRGGVYTSYTDFENPTIRNVEARKEFNIGGRTETNYAFQYCHLKGKITFGGEFQYFDSPVDVYDNNGGEKTNLQTDDDLVSHTGIIFSQVDLEWAKNFFLTAGASFNYLKYDFVRSYPDPVVRHKKQFDPVFSPRLALLKKWKETISVYASVSSGFSPPSLAEVRPSSNIFNHALEAERGRNIEWGVRGESFQGRVSYDVTIYDFRLKNTIVIQRNDDNAEYFINAGKTVQRGVEALMNWDVIARGTGTVSMFKSWVSYAYNHYRFKNYQNDGVDFSGNRLTGVAPFVISAGIDMMLRHRWYGKFSANYTDATPLNDANSDYAKQFLLVGIRAGFKTQVRKQHLAEFFIGADNLLDETYSLGNDLNAIGGRYYNAAMPRNYYAGIKVGVVPKK